MRKTLLLVDTPRYGKTRLGSTGGGFHVHD
jgi:hypothetical protein